MAGDHAINFAFQQNSIPVLRDVRVVNDGPEEHRDCEVRITAEPVFAYPIELRIASLPSGGEFRVGPVDLQLSPEFLGGLTEKIAGLLHIDVTAGMQQLVRHTGPVTLLAANEWCGLVSLPEILAAEGRAVCLHLLDVGGARIADAVVPILTEHDRLTRAASGLALA